MNPDPLLGLTNIIVKGLENAGIRYAITGSIASSIHGEPITSLDIDFVVSMTEPQGRILDRDLPQRLYRSIDRLIDTAQSGGIANLIDTETGLKVDLSNVRPGSLAERALQRARIESFGTEAPAFYTVTPEDIILMKLEWRKTSRSEKQWNDALGVARVKAHELDWDYLFQQARIVGIEQDLSDLRNNAGL